MAESFGAAFGRLVKKKRGEQKLNQGALGSLVFADRANTSPEACKQDVSKLERGEIADPHARIVAAYCRVLHISDAEVETLRRRVAEPEPAFVDALMEQNAILARALNLKEELVRALARRYAPDTAETFDSALVGLRAALETAAEMQRTARLPHNTSDQVDAVLTELDALNRDGKLEEGAQALAKARDAARDSIAQATSGLMRLLQSTVDQARLLNRPQDAADALVERLTLDTPADAFEALRAIWMEWYVRGRDKGLAFDATVAIHLAEHTLTRARTPDQRGSALNDLGAALQTLGDREHSTSRLEAAVEAFTEALKERTQTRVPLGWAATQNNLGAALATLGEREPGTSRLEAAVAAYTEALKEYTQARVPLDWAKTQSNLGAALAILGAREPGTARLEAAVVAYTEALKEYTQTRVPLDWAMTQNNLGITLRYLGEREPGTARLEAAVAAFAEALKECTQTLVPLDWASTQGNLAFVEIAFFDRTADRMWLASARTRVLSAREVFVAKGAGHYVGKSDKQLVQIAAREAS